MAKKSSFLKTENCVSQLSVTVTPFSPVKSVSGETAMSLSAIPICSISSVFIHNGPNSQTGRLCQCSSTLGSSGGQNAVVLIHQSCVSLFFSYTGVGVS